MTSCPCFELPSFSLSPPPEPWLALGLPEPAAGLSCPALTSGSLTNGTDGFDLRTFGGQTNTTDTSPDKIGIEGLLIYAIVGSIIGALAVIILAILISRHHPCCTKKKSPSKHILSTSSSASSGGDRLTQWTYDYMRPMTMTQSQMTLKEVPVREIHYASTDIFSRHPHHRTIISSPNDSPRSYGDPKSAPIDNRGITTIGDGIPKDPSYHYYETIESVYDAKSLKALNRHPRI